jgi:hypothetical protein
LFRKKVVNNYANVAKDGIAIVSYFVTLVFRLSSIIESISQSSDYQIVNKFDERFKMPNHLLEM